MRKLSSLHDSTKSPSISSRVIISLVAFALCAVTYWWFDTKFFNYDAETFYAEDKEAREKLGEMNTEIYEQLPPPPEGVTQTELIKNGGLGSTYYHGNYLEVTYTIDVTPEAVFAYYQPFFDSNDWEEYTLAESSSKLYFRKTSCLRVWPNYTEYFHGFSITIWHDYRQQSFSPEIPPLLGLSEDGKTYFDTCPPGNPAP